jgi:hypothetical protein
MWTGSEQKLRTMRLLRKAHQQQRQNLLVSVRGKPLFSVADTTHIRQKMHPEVVRRLAA